MKIQVVLPIYWTQEFKRKDNKTHLVSMNAYRNWFHYTQNNIKKHYHELVGEQLTNTGVAIKGQFRLHMELYYKNVNCDPSNVVALIEKFSLDAFQSCSVIVNDNVKYHLGTSWEVIGQDKNNPRCIVNLIGLD